MNYHTALDIAPPDTGPQAGQIVVLKPEWTAIVLAGQRPGPDPLACAFGQTHKALVRIDGQPMLARVLQCLLHSPSVGRIIVLAQEPGELLRGDLSWAASHDRIVPIVSSGGIAKSIADVAGSDAPWPVFVTTADHALLTPEMVEGFLGRTGDAELSIAAVERAVVQSRYDGCERTWLKFADGAYSGANMFALANGRTAAALSLWSTAEQDRKHAFRLFLHFGSGLALRAITRNIGFGPAIAEAGRKLGVSARLVNLDIAEAAIDVDKPSDHRLAEEILVKRRSRASLPQSVGLSVFDLDRTLTRKPTYTAFLAFAALRRNPLRLLLAPAVIACMVAYLAGLISRRKVKELEQAILLGRRISRRDIEALADCFARKIARSGVCKAGLARIGQERAEGRRVIMASAANAFYLDAIARQLGIDEVVATRSAWRGDQLLAQIEGSNCYGQAKQEMLSAYLDEQDLPRANADIRFFSDHVSDLPTFEWSDEPIAVNASRKLRKVAASRGWHSLQWN